MAARDDLMQLASHTDRRRWTRRIAGFTAVVLLLAQAIGAAHLHPLPSQHKYVASAAAVSTDGFCALCLFRFHSPTALVVTPYPTAPAVAELAALFATGSEPHSSYSSHLFGRAPPASV
jgi:hypothetical protein